MSTAHSEDPVPDNARGGGYGSAEVVVVAVDIKHLVPVGFWRKSRVDCHLRIHGACPQLVDDMIDDDECIVADRVLSVESE